MYTAPRDHAEDWPERQEIPDFTVSGGQYFQLDATGTTDPDGDSVSYLWSHYPEASGYPSYIHSLDRGNIRTALYQAPRVKRRTTLHIILRVTDKGTPRMTSYKRIIVKVKP